MSKRRKTSRSKSRKQATLFQQNAAVWLFAGLVIVILMVMFSVAGNQSAAAPSFESTTLTGETVRLSDYRGQVVMLNFWATWCPPCRAEMPTIQEMYEQRQQDGFVVLAINNAEMPAQVRPFVEVLSLEFPIVLDMEAQLQRAFAIQGYPTSIFIGPDGFTYATHSGLITEADMAAYIDEGLARANSAG